MNDIVRPLNEDKSIGYDRYGQLLLKTQSEDVTTTVVSHDLRNAFCSVCGRGWEMTSESWSDHFWWYRYAESVHESCWARRLSNITRDEFYESLCSAKIAFEKIVSIDNRYWSNGTRMRKQHWYQVDVHKHPIRIVFGVRKRFVHIEVTPLTGELDWHETADNAFANEDITKHFAADKIYVHAWSKDKGLAYFSKLAECGGFGRNKIHDATIRRV